MGQTQELSVPEEEPQKPLENRDSVCVRMCMCMCKHIEGRDYRETRRAEPDWETQRWRSVADRVGPGRVSSPFGLGAGARAVLVGLVLGSALPAVPVEQRAQQ